MSLKFFKNIDQYLESKVFEDNTTTFDTNSGQSGSSGQATTNVPEQTNSSSSGQAAPVPALISELGSKLTEWSKTFGTVFKFKYDHPQKGDATINKFDKNTDYISKLRNEIETPEGVSDNYPDKAVEAVKQLAAILNTGTYMNIKIYAIGSCSSDSTDSYNLELGGRRARIVKYALMKEIDPTKYNVQNIFAKSDGETRLVVTNDSKDDDNKDAIFGDNVDGNALIAALGKDNLKKTSVKRLLNQRVIFSVKYPADMITPDPKVLPKENEKPKDNINKYNFLFDPTAVDFLADSYLMKTEAYYDILKPFADKINKAGDKVKNIVIVGHAERVVDRKEYDTEDELKAMFVLSLNRGFAVQEKLQDFITSADIKFTHYGCGIDLSDDYTDFETDFKNSPRPEGNKTVEVFVNYEPKKSIEVYDKLSKEYKVESEDQIIPNDALLRIKVYNIYMKTYGTDREKIIKNIPLEFRENEVVNPHIEQAINELPDYMQKYDSGKISLDNYKKEIKEKVSKITVENFDKATEEDTVDRTTIRRVDKKKHRR